MAKVAIEEDNGFFEVYTPYDADFKDEIRRDFGAHWDHDLRVWLVDSSKHNKDDIETLCKRYFPSAFR